MPAPLALLLPVLPPSLLVHIDHSQNFGYMLVISEDAREGLQLPVGTCRDFTKKKKKKRNKANRRICRPHDIHGA